MESHSSKPHMRHGDRSPVQPDPLEPLAADGGRPGPADGQGCSVGAARPGAVAPRTWGPFTGGQLTTLILAGMAAAVIVPSTVSAIDAFTNVALLDPDTGTTANVDTNGRLAVKGSVTGTVTARPAPAADLVRGGTSVVNCVAVLTPPAGKALVITSIHVNVFANPTPGFANNVLLYSGASCAQLLDDVNPAGIGVTALDYGNGIAIPAGGALSARRQGGVQAEVYAFGYTVAADQVPAPLAAPTAPATASPNTGN